MTTVEVLLPYVQIGLGLGGLGAAITIAVTLGGIRADLVHYAKTSADHEDRLRTIEKLKRERIAKAAEPKRRNP